MTGKEDMATTEAIDFIDREIDRLQAENELLKKLLKELEDESGSKK